MADYVKSSVVLEVTTVDDQNNETVFKLDNPRSSGITLAVIRAAYANIISAGYLYSKQGYQVKSVARAAIVETTIERNELDS